MLRSLERNTENKIWTLSFKALTVWWDCLCAGGMLWEGVPGLEDSQEDSAWSLSWAGMARDVSETGTGCWRQVEASDHYGAIHSDCRWGLAGAGLGIARPGPR